MPKAQTNSSKPGAALLFVCIFATWRRNRQILGGLIYNHPFFAPKVSCEAKALVSAAPERERCSKVQG